MFRISLRSCSNLGKPWTSMRSKMSTSAPTSPSTDKAGVALFGSLCLVTAGLCVWQLNRYNWKVDLIEETKRRANQPPVDVRGDFGGYGSLQDNREQLMGHRLVVEGSFDHSREVLLGPRSVPVGLFGPAAQGMATNPQGFFVITPFRLKSGLVFWGEAIENDINLHNVVTVYRKEVFINRGWVAKAATSWNRPEGNTTLTAILSEPEPAGTFSPVNDVKSKKLLWLEKAALLLASDTKSEDGEIVIMDVVGDNLSNTPKEGPFPKPLSIIHEHYVQPITHLTYAFTWFSLTIFGTIMTYKKFRPRRLRR